MGVSNVVTSTRRVGAGHYHMRVSIPGIGAWMGAAGELWTGEQLVENGYLGICLSQVAALHCSTSCS